VSDAGQDGYLALEELPERCLAAALPAACRWAAAAAVAGAAAGAAIVLLASKDGVVHVKRTQTLHGHLHTHIRQHMLKSIQKQSRCSLQFT
jgi:hypothetical protein